MRGAATHLLNAFLVAFLVRGPVHASPLLTPRPSFFEGKGSTRLFVLIAPLDATAKAKAGLLEHAAEGAVDSSDRFEVLRGFDALDGSAARTRFDQENEARKLVADAKKALDDLDSATATKLYAGAIAAWKQADLTRGIEGLVEAQAGKAAGHSVSEENGQAKQEIERTYILAPKTKLSDAQFPPELLKYAESQRKAVKNAKGRLTVRTEPPGARVWVDGVYRGVSPVTAEQMANGQHLVVAALTGYALAVEDAPPGERLLTLKPAEMAYPHSTALEKIAKDPEGPGRDNAARELGSAVLADQVLLLVVKKGGGDKLDLTAVRLDTKDGHNFSYRQGSVAAAPAELRDFATGLLGPDDPRDGKSPVTHFAGGSSGTGKVSLKRVAGIALLGGAVLAGASWAVFGFSAMGQANLYKSLLQVETVKSRQAVSLGRTFALIADISWAAGAALLVAGVLLVLLGSGSGSSGGGRTGGSGKAAPAESDAMREYRQHQEEQRRLEEERAKQPPPPVEEKKPEEPPPPAPEEKKPEEKPPPPEEKKPEEKPAAEEKKKTPAEERAEKKRKAAEEKAERKRKAEEEKQKAAEEKKRAEEEKKQKAEEAKKAAEEEKQRKLDDEKRAKEEEEEKKRREGEDRDKKKQEKKLDEDDLRNF